MLGRREQERRGGPLRWMLLAILALPVLSHSDSPVLRIGVYENPPKVVQVNGQLSGIFGDVLQEIARREGWQIEAHPCVWQECLRRLEAGELDLLPDTALSQPRDRILGFHDIPVLRSWSQLYSARSQHITSLLDLQGLRLAVVEGSVQQDYLRDLTESAALQVEWVPVGSFAEGFDAVRGGQADMVAANSLYGDQRARELNLHVAPVVFQPVALYFSARPGIDPALLATLDRYLQDWQARPGSPWFQVMERWGVFAARDRLPMLVYWLVGAALLGVLLALWLAHSQRQRHRQAQARLNQSETHLETIMNGVDACIFTKDRAGRYQYVNHRFAELFGRPVAALVGRTDEDLFDAETVARLRAADRRVLEQGEKVSTQEVTVLRDGTRKTFLTVKLPLCDDGGHCYAMTGIATDLTEHLRIQDALNRAQYTDPVTGLANRTRLLERLDHALAGHVRTGFEGALLALDLRDFSLINDSQGHAAGDEVLRLVASRIRRCLSETDLAARLGADDFVILLEDLSTDRDAAIMEARHRASRIIAALTEPYRLDRDALTVGANIGVTMFSDAGDGVEAILRNADLALAAARAHESGQVRFFDPLMQERVAHRLRLENALRVAIDNELLDIHLQPQVGPGYRVIGLEVLLRWRDAELGVVSPAEFIPLAESTGLIVPLGQQVLERSCALLQSWRGHPLLGTLSLAINISPRQFHQADFVQRVEQCLARYQVPPGQLLLEVTEGLLINDIENVARRMQRLSALGVRFSLDDFGTGYASLAYLKRLPLYQLKIDQAFVRELLTDRNDEIIVKSTLEMGRSLGLDVIAEGVESIEQLQALEALGCQGFQGYCLGRPAPAADWEARLQGGLSLEPVQPDTTGSLAGAPATSLTSLGNR